jgi:hypothetical protein
MTLTTIFNATVLFWAIVWFVYWVRGLFRPLPPKLRPYPAIFDMDYSTMRIWGTGRINVDRAYSYDQPGIGDYIQCGYARYKVEGIHEPEPAKGSSHPNMYTIELCNKAVEPFNKGPLKDPTDFEARYDEVD